MKVEGIVTSLAYNPDSTLLAIGHSRGKCVLWDVYQQRQVGELSGHTGPIYSLAFTPDGLSLLSGGTDGKLLQWDISRPKRKPTLLAQQKDAILSLGFLEEDNQLAVGTGGGLRIWDRVKGQFSDALIAESGQVRTLAFSDSDRWAATTMTNRVVLFEKTARKELGAWMVPEGAQGGAHCTAVSPEGDHLAVPQADGSILLWRIQRKTPLLAILAPKEEANP